MIHSLDALVRQLNTIRRVSLSLFWVVRMVRSLLIAGTMLALWSLIKPDQGLEHLVLTLVAFVAALAFNSKSHSHTIHPDEVAVALEMKHPDAPFSPIPLLQAAPMGRDDGLLPQQDERAAVWQPHLQQAAAEMWAFERGRLVRLGTTLVLPLIFFLVASTMASGSMTIAVGQVVRVVAHLTRGATIKVVEGAVNEAGTKEQSLSSSRPLELELLAQNMVEIRVSSGDGNRPRIDLKRRIPGGTTADPQNPVIQSFQLSPLRETMGDEDSGRYVVAFAVENDVELYVNILSEKSPAAIIKVKEQPVPKVRLEATESLTETWPDDKPVPLRIDVTADNPLQQVRLVIKSDGKTSSELVANVMTDDKKELSSNYNLVLEPYMQGDMADIEVVAEAIDRSVPAPLLGRSQPLIIRAASAYGRYQQTLQTLREIKTRIDDAASNQKQLDAEAGDLVSKAVKQSAESPFFDGLDRLTISQIEKDIKATVGQGNKQEQLLNLSGTLNDFLFEHETLDDRERDRDFFVAARTLSRVIDQKRDERKLQVDAVTERVKKYLTEREKRWELRIKYMGADKAPAQWERIKQHPFHKAMDEIAALDRTGAKADEAKALSRLTQTVEQYRQWIEDLEKAEDAARASEEAKRQEGLASARETLKELQKRQGDISSKLDQAAVRKEDDLTNQWPAVRMDQNANIKGTASLEAQLRSLSPAASERIKAALDSMNLTLESGNNKSYAQAESASDLAGRLLRQAQSETQKSQRQPRRSSGRRRVTGDNYFGSQVAGGDVEIKREYKVNRRYREEILEDVRRHGQTQQEGDGNDTLLEEYLRRVVR